MPHRWATDVQTDVRVPAGTASVTLIEKLMPPADFDRGFMRAGDAGAARTLARRSDQAQGAGTAAASAEQTDARRREKRTGVLKGAKIIFGPTIIDCVVLDVSSGGARVRTPVVVSVPEEVTLRFSGGSAFVAHRQWTAGTEIGFAFDRLAPPPDDTSSLAMSAFSALPANDLELPMRLLRSVRFFDDPVLEMAAEQAEAAYMRFKRTLKERIKFPG